MSEHVYKIVELTGSSKKGVDAAVQNAIARASKSIRNMSWFQIIETRGHIQDNAVAYWQVTIKVGFHVE